MSNTLKEKFSLIDILSRLSGIAYEDEVRNGFINSHYNFIRSKSSLCPEIPLYLNSALHDSEVTSISYKNNSIYISLNDFSTHCLCDALVDLIHLNLPHNKRVFPISLTFDDISTFSISYINRNNKMIRLNRFKYLPRLSAYVFDQVLELEPDSVTIGIIFWANASSNKNYLLLQIKSKKLIIEEFQKRAFLKLFNGKFIGLFDAYWKERQKGILFDYSHALEFINKNIQI